MANREYFYHSSKLILRFTSLMDRLVKTLQSKFEKPSLIKWLFSSHALPTFSERQLRCLKTDLKYFEVCVRVFEQVCIETILSTQQEVMNRNIDQMFDEQCSSVPSRPKQILNQLLDSSGHLIPKKQAGVVICPLKPKDQYLPQPNFMKQSVQGHSHPQSTAAGAAPTNKENTPGLFLPTKNAAGSGMTTRSASFHNF